MGARFRSESPPENREDHRGVRALASNTKETESRLKREKWAVQSGADARIAAMKRLARDQPGISVSQRELDVRPFLLNCKNGTLDLRTGELRRHDPADLQTICLPHDYDPSATCPRWLKYLDRVMAGDSEMIGYLQRVAGYALTASTREHCLFLLHGPGRNGKSVFLNVIRWILDGYATATDSNILLARDCHHTALAALQGKRLVTISEPSTNGRLDESKVKSLASEDPITARWLYGNPFTFEQTHKFFLAANYLPEIHDQDQGIWSRIRPIPFSVTIPEAERDKHLLEWLKDEAGGILAWMVEGCLDWQRRGHLAEPRAVLEAWRRYKEETDPLRGFLEDCCVLGDGHRIKPSLLHAAYLDWARSHPGELANPLNPTSFGRSLSSKGIEVKESGGVRYRVGITLKSSASTRF